MRPGHQHRGEDEWGCREKADPPRSREERSGLDDTQEAGDFDRVVLVIVVLALIFILVMTYLVAQMPQKP